MRIIVKILVTASILIGTNVGTEVKAEWCREITKDSVEGPTPGTYVVVKISESAWTMCSPLRLVAVYPEGIDLNTTLFDSVGGKGGGGGSSGKPNSSKPISSTKSSPNKSGKVDTNKQKAQLKNLISQVSTILDNLFFKGQKFEYKLIEKTPDFMRIYCSYTVENGITFSFSLKEDRSTKRRTVSDPNILMTDGMGSYVVAEIGAFTIKDRTDDKIYTHYRGNILISGAKHLGNSSLSIEEKYKNDYIHQWFNVFIEDINKAAGTCESDVPGRFW